MADEILMTRSPGGEENGEVSVQQEPAVREFGFVADGGLHGCSEERDARAACVRERGYREAVSGTVLLVSECETDVVVPQGVAGGVGEVAVVLCTWGLEGLGRRGGSVECGPWMEFVAPCAVPGAWECALDGLFEAVTCIKATW